MFTEKEIPEISNEKITVFQSKVGLLTEFY